MKVTETVLVAVPIVWLDEVMETMKGLRSSEETTEEAPKKRGRPAKMETFEESEETEETEIDENETPPKKAAKGPTLDTVIDTIQSFIEDAGADGRKKAGKILAKFKVKSVHDLDESDYPKIIKMFQTA